MRMFWRTAYTHNSLLIWINTYFIVSRKPYHIICRDVRYVVPKVELLVRVQLCMRVWAICFIFGFAHRTTDKIKLFECWMRGPEAELKTQIKQMLNSVFQQQWIWNLLWFSEWRVFSSIIILLFREERRAVAFICIWAKREFGRRRTSFWTMFSWLSYTILRGVFVGRVWDLSQLLNPRMSALCISHAITTMNL